jgi:hypothetical protein
VLGKGRSATLLLLLLLLPFRPAGLLSYTCVYCASGCYASLRWTLPGLLPPAVLCITNQTLARHVLAEDRDFIHALTGFCCCSIQALHELVGLPCGIASHVSVHLVDSACKACLSALFLQFDIFPRMLSAAKLHLLLQTWLLLHNSMMLVLFFHC